MQPRWKKLVALAFAATLSLGASGCGDDVVDDDVEEDVENLGDEVENEVDPGTE